VFAQRRFIAEKIARDIEAEDGHASRATLVSLIKKVTGGEGPIRDLRVAGFTAYYRRGFGKVPGFQAEFGGGESGRPDQERELTTDGGVVGLYQRLRDRASARSSTDAAILLRSDGQNVDSHSLDLIERFLTATGGEIHRDNYVGDSEHGAEKDQSGAETEAPDHAERIDKDVEESEIHATVLRDPCNG
jgi:hypothetical protein